MAFTDSFVPEFDHEMNGTRQILERVPNSLLGWKAHASLNSIGWLASHIADTMSWVEVVLTESSFDVAPVGQPPHESPVLESSQSILTTFDDNLARARELLVSVTDEQMLAPWTLLHGGNELFTMPRSAVAKSFFINHVIHHRAFLVAYLRMNDVECPRLYG